METRVRSSRAAQSRSYQLVLYPHQNKLFRTFAPDHRGYDVQYLAIRGQVGHRITDRWYLCYQTRADLGLRPMTRKEWGVLQNISEAEQKLCLGVLARIYTLKDALSRHHESTYRQCAFPTRMIVVIVMLDARIASPLLLRCRN